MCVSLWLESYEEGHRLMHADPEPREMGSSEMLRIAVMRVVIELYRVELLGAAGFFESGDEDPDRLLYRVVLEAERRHARDHGVDRGALVLDKEFREMLVDSSSDVLVDEGAADELIEEIVAEAERRWVCQIIGVEVFDVDGDDEEIVRRPRRRRSGRFRCDGDEEGSCSG